MFSIALFPCSYTDEARIIGELSHHLQLRVSTDQLLFAYILEQFGIPIEETKKIICDKMPSLHRYMLKKDKYVNMLRCSLDAQRRSFCNRYIYYGLHTSLLDCHEDKVLKVLVVDDEENRVRRAMQLENLPERMARKHIINHDEKVSNWTQFLFKKNAYDQSLYHLVIEYGNRDFFEITDQIIHHYLNMNDLKKTIVCSSYLHAHQNSPTAIHL